MKAKLTRLLSLCVTICMLVSMLSVGGLVTSADTTSVTSPNVSYTIGEAYKYTSGDGSTALAYGTASPKTSTAISSVNGNTVTLGTTASTSSTSTNFKLIYVPVAVTATVPANTEGYYLRHDIAANATRVVADTAATATASAAVYYLGDSSTASSELTFYPYYSNGASKADSDAKELGMICQGKSSSTQQAFSGSFTQTICYENSTDAPVEVTHYFGVMIVITNASTYKNTTKADFTFTAEHSHNYGTTGVCFCGNVYVDERAFPDANFLEYVKTLSGADDLILTPTELAAIRTIDVISKSIASLKGIEYFIGITELDCRNNQLESLDISNNTALKTLYCNRNQLTELDVSKNTSLKYLSCSNNQLTGLDASKNTALEELYCYNNQLTELDVSKNTKLTSLYCYDNQMTELDVSNNTELTKLDFCENQLTEIDISKSTKLTELDFYDNQLTEIDVSNNTKLTRLNCHTNQLTSLDVSKNTALKTLYCNNNQLTSLDVSKNTALQYLYCNNNHLTSLDLSKNTLNDDPQVSEYDGTKQTASIEIDPITRNFDISTLDSDFDSSKVINLTEGCSFNGNVLTVGEGVTSVAYSYAADDIGHSLGVTLAVTVPEIHKHDDVIFDEWTATGGTISVSGNYYLTDNLTATSTIKISEGADVTLCLNDKTFDFGEYRIENKGTLTICDCKGGGELTNYILNDGTLTFLGGNITGRDYGIFNNRTGIVTVSGGSISSNATGLPCIENSGTITVSGGSISGKTGISNSGILEIKGDAQITGTSSYGILNYATLYLSGSPKISGNETNCADIGAQSNKIYAVSSDGNSVYTPTEDVTVMVYSLYEGYVIIRNVNDSNKDKFIVTNDGYTLAQGTGDNANNLVLAVKNAVTNYSLYIDGIQVTSENAADILGTADEGATASYNASTSTLTLNGFNSTGTIKSYLENLNIELVGNNTIDTDNDYAISAGGTTVTIDGSGSLTVSSKLRGIEVYALTVNGGTITSTGEDIGIIGRTGVNITGGNVTGIGTKVYGIDCYDGGIITISGGNVIAKTESGDPVAFGKAVKVTTDYNYRTAADGAYTSANAETAATAREEVYYEIITGDIPHTHDDVTFDKWTATGGTISASGNYYIAEDITATGSITIDSSADVTLCLNGHTLDMGSYYIENNGTLTVCDCQSEQGKITSSGTYCIYNKYFTPKTKGSALAVLNIKGGIIESTATVDYSSGIYNDGGTVTVSGGSVFVGTATVSGETYGIINKSGTITVSGGSVVGDNGISNPYSGTVIISGGEVTGRRNNAISGFLRGSSEQEQGVVQVSGGTVEGSTGVSGYNDTVTITGGTVIGNVGQAVYSDNSTVSISGEPTLTGYRGIYVGGTTQLNISGGSISSTGEFDNGGGFGIWMGDSINATISGGSISGIVGIGFYGNSESVLYLYGNPVISCEEDGVDITLAEGKLYAQSNAATPVKYSGQPLTIFVEDEQEGNAVVYNGTLDKFSLMSDSYALAEGTGDNLGNLVIKKLSTRITEHSVIGTNKSYSFNLQMKSPEATSGTFVVALINGAGEIVGVKTITLDEAKDSYSKVDTITTSSDAETYKITFWSGLDTVKPLCESVSGKITAQ